MCRAPSAHAADTALRHHIALRITPLHSARGGGGRLRLLWCCRFRHRLLLRGCMRVMQHGGCAHTCSHVCATTDGGGDTYTRIASHLSPLVHAHTHADRAHTRADTSRDSTCSHAHADAKWPHRHTYPDTRRGCTPRQQAASHQSQKQCFHACHCPPLAFPAQIAGTFTCHHLHKK